MSGSCSSEGTSHLAEMTVVVHRDAREAVGERLADVFVAGGH
jgi:hypothetical protein